MATNPAAADAYKKAVLKTDQIVKAQKKINPRFEELSTKLPAAIKAADGPMVELYLKSLQVLIRDIDNSLNDTRLALGFLDTVEDDEDFVSTRLQDVEKVTKLVSDARSSLTNQYKTAKQLENQAEKSLEGQHGTQEAAFRELAQLDKWITDEKKELVAAFQKAEQLNTKATNAFEARDARHWRMPKSHAGTGDRCAEDHIRRHESSLKKFQQRAEDKRFTTQTTAELKDGVQDLLSRHIGSRVYLDQLEKTEKRVLEFKIAEIDIKKAAKVLELDSKAEPKLAKVLKGPGPAIEKGLEALAKELKLKTSGKEMAAALRKAGVL
jgi:hypothetical protein